MGYEQGARNKLRDLDGAMRQAVDGGISVEEVAEINRVQLRIKKLLAKLEELDGEHHEET